MSKGIVLDRCVVVGVFNHFYASSGDCRKDTPLMPVFGYLGGFILNETVYLTSLFCVKRNVSSFFTNVITESKEDLELASSYFKENGNILLGVYKTTSNSFNKETIELSKNASISYLIDFIFNKNTDIEIKTFSSLNNVLSPVTFEIKDSVSTSSLLKELEIIQNTIYNESEDLFSYLNSSNSNLNDCWLYFKLNYLRRNKLNYSIQEELSLLKERNEEMEKSILERKLFLFENFCKKNKDADWSLFEKKISSFLNTKINNI